MLVCYNKYVLIVIPVKIFQKKVEDFSCEQCGFFVVGDGYTNHCPRCLFAKHVDVNPGDRLESCGGLMEPIAYEQTAGQERITHCCVRCGVVRNNKVQKEDDFETLLSVAKKRAAKSV